jgi:hypothetical protein
MSGIAAHPGTPWLIVGGAMSVVAALLHLGCIVGGPDWYRFFGAGEGIARAAARGDWYPAVITTAIAAMLAIWAAYAFAGAGYLPRLPLLRTVLVLIALVYLLRALAFVPVNLVTRQYSDSFAIWSSLIVLAFGIAYAVGTWKAWRYLAP